PFPFIADSRIAIVGAPVRLHIECLRGENTDGTRGMRYFDPHFARRRIALAMWRTVEIDVISGLNLPSGPRSGITKDKIRLSHLASLRLVVQIQIAPYRQRQIVLRDVDRRLQHRSPAEGNTVPDVAVIEVRFPAPA